MNRHTLKHTIASSLLGLLLANPSLAQQPSELTPDEQQEIAEQADGLQTEMEEQKPDTDEVQRTITPEIKPEAILLVYDPWSPMNRVIYDFNAVFDDYVFLPTTRAYQAITPDPVETGISNFFSNLGEVGNLFNNILQLRVKDSGITVARFVVNSTVGILGFWDPSSKIGLYKKPEDFGQTLGYWGLGSGPYLVLPFMGPSSLRDAGGSGVDLVISQNVDLLDVKDDANKDDIRIATTLLNAIDTRKNTGFRYYNTGSPFEYELVRYAHHELRKIEIEK